MNTSEPTTGEIVEAIRACEDRATCHGCIFLNCKSFDCNSPEAIADRLESQEQKLELLNGGDFDVIDIPAALAYLESVEEILPHASALIDLIQSLKGTAIELTARAEQADKERNLAVKALTDYEDALFDEKDKAYNNGYGDGYQDGTKAI